MSAFVSPNSLGSSSDRLLITIFLAALVHALVIFGVTFDLPKPSKIIKSLEIALVKAPSQQAPDKAEYLAQENQFGSGTALEKAKPKTNPFQVMGGSKPQSKRGPSTRGQEVNPRPVLTQAKSEKKVTLPQDQNEKSAEPHPVLTAGRLSQQIAQLGVEITQAQENLSKRPRIKFINSVNAHKHKAAAYEKAWQDKVERIGNLNYPDDARRKRLSGSLLMSVGVKRDGSIYSIKIRVSSGHKALDDGAIRIVRLAAPFAPFPRQLGEDADVLVITRTWKFTDDSHLTTSG